MKAPLLNKITEANLSSVAIFGGAGVDPDGLACVEAMTAIILKLNPDSIVDKYYRGKFDRPQNKTMRELLQLKQKSTDKFLLDNTYTCIISVDGPASVCPTQPHFIIDHHPEKGEALIAQDIRLIGSCSAIMWEYAMEAGLEWNTEDGKKIATALAIGIDTDTIGKTSETTSDLDWEADAWCGKHREPSLYTGIKNYPQPHYYMDMLSYAWSHKVIEGTCLVTELGNIPEERTGVISDIADKLSQMAGVSTSVVISCVNGDFIGSARSTDSSLGMDEFCKAIGDGGGRPGAGKITIKMPPVYSSIKDETLLNQHFKAGYDIISNKIFQYMGDGVRSKPKE